MTTSPMEPSSSPESDETDPWSVWRYQQRRICTADIHEGSNECYWDDCDECQSECPEPPTAYEGTSVLAVSQAVQHARVNASDLVGINYQFTSSEYEQLYDRMVSILGIRVDEGRSNEQTEEVMSQTYYAMEQEAAAADIAIEELDLVQQANFALGWLTGKAMRFQSDTDMLNWQDSLDAVLTETEKAAAIKAARTKAEDFDAIIGVVPAGTAIVREEAIRGITAERAAEIVTLLKNENKILQCGRGRGKALIVMSRTPLDPQIDLTPEVPAVSTTPQPGVTVATPVSSDSMDTVAVVRNDVPILLQAVKEQYTALLEEKEAAERRVLELDARVADLEALVQTRDNDVEALQQRIAQQSMITWQ